MRRVVASAMVLLWLGRLAAAGGSEIMSDRYSIDWSKISAESMVEIPIKPTDRSLLRHQHEKRGFVAVPLDYSMPAGRQIDIFYRLLPSDRLTGAESGKPILMVMNGGPGMPSSGYRPIDHDYEAGNAVDAFSELAKHFRILMVDQRGTGNSAPLDLDDPALSPEVIAHFFDSDELARDHSKVVDAVIPESEEFLILARSYGGEIGFQYLTLGSDVRKPAGIIFSSAVLPHTDALETFLMRRRKQRELNLELQTANPEIVAKLSRLRSHLHSLGIDPETVNFLWSNLGSGVAWEIELEKKVDSLIAIDDRAAIETEFGQGIRASVNLLNYVLSSSSLTPGYTDRSMTAETSRQIPFDPWMLDENWTLNQIGNDGTWREQFVGSVDRNPPPPINFPPVEEIRRAFLRNQALFTFGASDAFLPQDLQFNRAKKFDVPGHTEFRSLSGGHGAAFSEEGVSVVVDWADRILDCQGNCY